MKSCRSDEMVMYLEVAADERLPVGASMGYDIDDPHAVRLEFTYAGSVLACWYLDREMLAEGLLRPVGVGNVRLGPATDGTRPALRLRLRGHVPQGPGEAVLCADASDVALFLERSYALVALGSEAPPVEEFLERVFASE
ncbi:SsgA family sporulation/cell division regulator [Streptomyces sp. NPDC087917]|uniref:SsgA family sporulation/cell division regulator n=1 Tax=Streptomyces sp. NPDC087917 TaxID=3155060 RepID=UPI00343C58F0